MSHEPEKRPDEPPSRRHIVGDRLDFSVLASDTDLDECCRFLKGQAPPSIGNVRIGRIGSLEAFLARSTDTWDVDVRMYEVTGRADGTKAEVARFRALRSDLLKAFLPPPSHVVEERASVPAPSAVQVEHRAVVKGHTLRNAADVRDLMLYVATHLKTPHVDVCISTFSDLERQRAQSRITHLAEAGEYNSLGSIAAVATLIIGTITVTLLFLNRTMEERFIDAYVTSTRLWEYAVGLVIVTACAWLAGRILGVLWCRLRLLAFLFRVLRRARLQEQEGRAEH